MFSQIRRINVNKMATPIRKLSQNKKSSLKKIKFKKQKFRNTNLN